MNPLSTLGIALIRAYQLCLSPWLGANCRFHPTCSSYATDALKTHGFFKGSFFAARRLARCNPLFESRYDPLPLKNSNQHAE